MPTLTSPRLLFISQTNLTFFSHQKLPNFLLNNSISFQKLTNSSPPPHPPPLHLPPIQSQNTQSHLSVDQSLLPPNLQNIVSLFQSVPDSKAKYQQLLSYGTKLPPLDPVHKTEPNRVQGCVSRVWVHASKDPDQENAIKFQADSDSALTKGLAALLVFGLSGSPASVIATVPVEFIELLGIKQTLTPSRNNGLLNMFRLMQRKAMEIEAGIIPEEENNLVAVDEKLNNGDHFSLPVEEEEEEENLDDQGGGGGQNDVIENEFSSSAGNGRKERMIEKLKKGLSPVELEIEDVSHMHRGHAGVAGSDGETHFNVRVVSKEFEGKSLVKRHRLVYGLLQEELDSGLHALSIDAKTPSEV